MEQSVARTSVDDLVHNESELMDDSYRLRLMNNELMRPEPTLSADPASDLIRATELKMQASTDQS